MIAIKCGLIHTMGPSGTIKDGVILIDGSKILDAGQGLSIPGDARFIDASDCHASPGFIDAHTHIGLVSEGSNEAGNDSNEMSNPITPHLRAIDGVDTFDPAFREILEAGVTTIMVMPGSANPIGGGCSVLKTWGGTLPRMLMVENAGMKFALGENPKRVYSAQKKSPFTRMGTAGMIRESLFKARDYLYRKEKAQEDEKEKDKFKPDFVLEALQDIVQKKAKGHFHCHQAYDIMTALRIADEFELSITLEHCTEGDQVAGEIASRGIPVVLSPMMHARSKVETSRRHMEIAANLTGEGITVAISTDGISQQARWLPINAGLCVRYGMKEEDALKAITINPAKIMDIDSRVGSIQPGKDADIVLTDGHPLQTMTRTRMVIGGGEILLPF